MILIDDRVGSAELKPYISAPTTLTRLDYGDVAFTGHGPDDTIHTIGIERKGIQDLTASIQSGRLSGHQLVGLLSNYHHVYLLIEGIWRANPNNGILEKMAGSAWRAPDVGKRRWMYRDVANYCNSLAVQCGIVLWQTANKRQSGQWVTGLYHWWQKEYIKHHALEQFRIIPPVAQYRKPGLVHRVAKELKGVGWERGRDIVRRFKTVEELVLASEEELMEVEGIGRKLAMSMREEMGHYG